MKTYKWLWGYASKFKTRIIIGFLMVLVGSALNMVSPKVTEGIIDKVVMGGKHKLLPSMLVIIVVVVVLKSINRFVYRLNFESISQNIIFDIREDIYCKLQKLDFDFFNTTPTGDIMTKLTADIDNVRHVLAWTIFNIFEDITLVLFALTMMFSINYKLALLMLLITPITGVIAYKLAKSVKPAFLEMRKQFSRLNSVVQENISGNRVVKAFAKEDYEIEKFEKENYEFKRKNLDITSVWEKYFPPLEFVASSLSIVILLVGGIMTAKGWMTVGELVAFGSYVWALNNPMRMAGWLINETERFVASGENIILLLEEKPKIRNAKAPVKKENIKGKVEFKDVSFEFEDEKVLKEINFKANPGQTVAIIGPTGAGKSTLMNLVCRFYDATDGEVLIDDVNIKNIHLKKLRNNVAVTMQDIFLFSNTVEANIAYGVPEAPFEQIKHVADLAGAHNFIEDLPDGYDTIVGERGVGLSGGQKQRIALARALLKDPSILILDDTTSSVDMKTEYEIQKTLKTYFSEKTTFIIAHRISSVKNADMILVLENGRIVERGNHEELISAKGYYYKVYKDQLGDFDNNDCMEVG